MRVLIADDEPVARRVLRAQLEKFGHDVVAAEDGAQALEALTAPDAPRLAVLDWNMPHLDGVDVCRKLRGQALGPYTYVVLLTSRQGQEDLVVGLESGANDFISKPVDAGVLRARLRVGERLLAMEAEIRRYSAYLGAVLANIGSGVVLVDPMGRVVFANPAALALAGFADGESRERTRANFVVAIAERSTEPRHIQAGLRGVEGVPIPPAGLEMRIELGGDERCWIQWTGQPVALPGGDGWMDVFRDVTSDVELNRTLAEAANTDHLTRLLNRRGGEMAISREIARARRDRTPLSFALFDIDHFKRVNDSYGHGAGDRVISEVTTRVASTVRAYDLAIRWGGEEVLVVLPGANIPDAAVVAERVRLAISALAVEGIPPVTISAGVDSLGHAELSADAAIKRADAKLYEAKAGGRNRVVS